MRLDRDPLLEAFGLTEDFTLDDIRYLQGLDF